MFEYVVLDMFDSESDAIMVSRPPTVVAAASADQGNRWRKRHREDAQHRGACGPLCLMAVVSCSQARWAEELASATEAERHRQLGAWTRARGMVSVKSLRTSHRRAETTFLQVRLRCRTECGRRHAVGARTSVKFGSFDLRERSQSMVCASLRSRLQRFFSLLPNGSMATS